MKSPSKFLAFALAAFIAAPVLHAQREKLPAEDVEIVEKEFPKAIVEQNTDYIQNLREVKKLLESRDQLRRSIPKVMVMGVSMSK